MNHGRQRLAGGQLSDPNWEAAKAARRNLSLDAAIQECQSLLQQYRDQWSNRLMTSPVELYQVLRTLRQKRIPFVLTGAHGIGGWTGRPRGTRDLDILVKGGRHYARAVKAMRTLYPDLELREFHGVTAFFLPGEKESVLDITYPHRADIEETLAHPVWVENAAQKLRYRIPVLEAVLAHKYGAMLTATRDSRKRRQDILDFEWMVTHSLDEGQRPIDLERLAALGEKVWPTGGGQEILRLVELVKHGSAIQLDSLG